MLFVLQSSNCRCHDSESCCPNRMTQGQSFSFVLKRLAFLNAFWSLSFDRVLTQSDSKMIVIHYLDSHIHLEFMSTPTWKEECSGGKDLLKDISILKGMLKKFRMMCFNLDLVLSVEFLILPLSTIDPLFNHLFSVDLAAGCCPFHYHPRLPPLPPPPPSTPISPSILPSS